MELTEEIVDEVFDKCYFPYEEMMKMRHTFTEETAPDIAPLMVPLPNGANAVAFRSEELKESKPLINELLDQIDWFSRGFNILFQDLMKKIDGTLWTDNIYEMQKLYALAIASDLINREKTNNGYIVKRLKPSEAKVTLVGMNKQGKIKQIKK